MKRKKLKLFDPESFSSKLVSLYVIIIVFAPFVPILAFVGVIAIVSRTAGVRVMMGRLLEEFTQSYDDSAHGRDDNGDIKQPVSISPWKRKLSRNEEKLKFQSEVLQVLKDAIEKFPVSLLWRHHDQCS